MFIEKFQQWLGSAFPASYRRYIREQLNYADMGTTPERFVGGVWVFSATLCVAVYLLLALMGGFSPQMNMLISVSAAVLSLFMLHGVVFMAVSNRKDFIENVLPDVLQLIAVNLRSNMTPDRALLLAARDEFGPLKSEINKAAKVMITGCSFEEALGGITKKFDSKILKQSLTLVSEGIRSGGELDKLLDSVSLQIREMRIVQGEVKAIVMMYIIFISAASVVGAPLLHALSIFLVQMMSQLSTSVEMPAMIQTSLMKMGGTGVTTDFLWKFAVANLTFSAFFGSMIIGLIYSGKETNGVKYLPLFLLLSLAVLFVSYGLIDRTFGVMTRLV